MKRLFKAIGGIALTAALLVSVSSCNFINSNPIKGFISNIFGGGTDEDTHVHTLEKQDAVEATCTQAGTKAYYLCTDPDCNMMFSDLNGENEIYAPEMTEKKGHSLSKTLAKAATCMETGYEAYYTCTSCRKMFSDEEAKNEISAPKQIGISGHTLLKTEAKAATETKAGNLEYYSCSVCKKLFSDAEGKAQTTLAQVYLAPTADLKWNALAGVSDYAAPSYSNGVTTFNALNNSAYIENVFVDENGNSLVGAYDYTNANTEYTYSMNIKAGGTFHLILFANETTIPVFATADLNNSPKYGFYIRFDSTDAETNVKLQAALGNSEAEQGVKAKGSSSFVFDGTTENEIRLVLERYKADTLILHIWVNGEEISFTKTSNGGPDKIGFIMRTAWDRNDLITGIGDSYTSKNAKAYPTISCSRGLSETEGFGAGLAIAVTGNISSNAISGEGQATVVLSHLTATKTGEQVTHEHELTYVEGWDATCTLNGQETYYSCTCGSLFSDAEGTNRIAAPVVIPASHKLSHVDKVDPTESEGGCKEYWSCGVCFKLYADEKGNVETTLDALYLPPESHEHSLDHIPAASATALKDGNVEYWYCEGCKTYFADSEASQELESVVVSLWTSLKDITESTKVTANGAATLTGAGSSSYVDNMFAQGLAGAYDPTVANTEYTLTAKFKTNSSFAFILFANDSTTHEYTTNNIVDNVSEKLGYYIIFESDDAENQNVKLKAAVGNGTSKNPAEAGVKAKATATVHFDGVTDNELKVTIERYSVDKVIMHIYVNSEEAISFNMTGTKNADVCGFNLRTLWDRTSIIGESGIGDSYNKKEFSYPTLSISRGLSEAAGLGCGLGVSVYGVKTDGAYTGLTADGSAASVTITELSVAVTGEQVVHTHTGELVEGSAANCTENGYEAYYECACGKMFSDEACANEIAEPVVIEAKHSVTLIEATESTCEEAGYEAYYKCTVCEKLFSDEAATTEIEAPVAKALAAHKLEKTEKVEATEDSEGNAEYWTCSVCHKLFSDEAGTVETNAESVKIPALGHTHDMSYVDEKAATCTDDGNVGYWHCDGCGKNYNDENGETELASVVIKASHSLEYTAAVAATALKDGNVEYWYCDNCETYFADSEASQELESIVVSLWTSLKDITESTKVTANGAATLTGKNSSSYVDNMFAQGLAGAYDPTVANTEYTLTAKFKTNSSFAFILFANDSTTHEYTTNNIVDNVSEKLGYYIIFECDDADGYNVKLKAAVGNGTSKNAATSGVKAKAKVEDLYFDGEQENTLKVTIERYSTSKVILHIYVNSEEAISFNLTSTAGANVCGFTLRTAWDRTNIVDEGGIGDNCDNKNDAYPTISISRGLSETEGLGCGLGVSVYGVKDDNGYTGLASDGSAASVTITELSVAVTGERIVAAE